MPEMASRTLDFPDDWSPITAICGIGTCGEDPER
jgi:hypothetical protein